MPSPVINRQRENKKHVPSIMLIVFQLFVLWCCCNCLILATSARSISSQPEVEKEQIRTKQISKSLNLHTNWSTALDEDNNNNEDDDDADDDNNDYDVIATDVKLSNYAIAVQTSSSTPSPVKQESKGLVEKTRQVSDLLIVQQNVTATADRVRRQLVTPTPTATPIGTTLPNLDDNALATISSGSEQLDNNNNNNNIDDENFSAGALEPVTCSPDYEDNAMIMMDAQAQTQTQSQLQTQGGELLPGVGGEVLAQSINSNLTQEQRQLLLNNAADSLDSLEDHAHQAHAGAAAAGNGGGGGAVGQVQAMPCMPAGLRRIEIITKTITPILFSIIIVVGLLGNIIVMLVILEDRKLERELTPTNLLILDLSLADLSFIIFCIPFTGWDYAVGHWVFGSLWCKFNQYLIVVCALSSIYTLVLMSCDRFMAIVYPIECINYRTSRNMLKAIVIKWIVILLIALPSIHMHGLIDSPMGPGRYICRFLTDRHNPLHFQIIFFITSYLFPLILIFCLYLSLLNKLWFGQKPHGHKESHKMLESKKKVTWLVASIVIVFAACWCPIQIMLILMRIRAHQITATYVAIQVFAHTLGYMNSCVNPIVYAFASETFNQSFKKSWLGRWFSCVVPGGGTNNNGTNQSVVNYTHNNNEHVNGNGNHNSQNFKLSNLTLNTRQSNDFGHATPTRAFQSRNSLQIVPLNSGGGGGVGGGLSVGHAPNVRNQSLNHIFKSSSPSPKPKLEPRDRPQVVSPSSLIISSHASANNNQQQQQQQQIDLSMARQQVSYSPTTPTTTTNANEHQQLVPRGPTTSAKVFQSLQKQQLVARITQQSTNSNQQVVAHECEPRVVIEEDDKGDECVD